VLLLQALGQKQEGDAGTAAGAAAQPQAALNVLGSSSSNGRAAATTTSSSSKDSSSIIIQDSPASAMEQLSLAAARWVAHLPYIGHSWLGKQQQSRLWAVQADVVGMAAGGPEEHAHLLAGYFMQLGQQVSGGFGDCAELCSGNLGCWRQGGLRSMHTSAGYFMQLGQQVSSRSLRLKDGTCAELCNGNMGCRDSMLLTLHAALLLPASCSAARHLWSLAPPCQAPRQHSYSRQARLCQLALLPLVLQHMGVPPASQLQRHHLLTQPTLTQPQQRALGLQQQQQQQEGQRAQQQMQVVVVMGKMMLPRSTSACGSVWQQRQQQHRLGSASQQQWRQQRRPATPPLRQQQQRRLLV
jgi:hypothetical protein